jgi:toxin ParE1/3/4
MPRLIYLPSAAENLRAIHEYTLERNANAEVALSFVRQLRQRCDKIAGLSQIMGRARPELAEGIRSISESHYVIFLRYAGDPLEIVNIVEGHRDIEALFGPRGDQ